MDIMKVGIIGVGNMGSKYAKLIQDGDIPGFELAALTRVRGAVKEMLSQSIDNGVPVFETADDLFESLEKGDLKLDCVIIATPHFSHEEYALRAFQNGLHVLSDKPAGVYLRQAISMNEAATEAGKVYAMVFNQRTNPAYKKIKEIIESGVYGKIKRVNWVVTDWYRPEKYFTSSSWHATWKLDGGGLLLNQCPHNLDLLQWMCGMPKRVQGFCHEGRFHDIEVEDDVTVYFEWENATGTFISSTGDAPGINRLEISLDEAMIIYDKGVLSVKELLPEIGMTEAEYMKTSDDYFRKLNGVERIIEVGKEANPYQVVLANFASACNNGTALLADGREGYNSLLLSNAIYLSSWEHRMVELPEKDTREEAVFNETFEKHMSAKIEGSSAK